MILHISVICRPASNTQNLAFDLHDTRRKRAFSAYILMDKNREKIS
jgi:hypothetical protein